MRCGQPWQHLQVVNRPHRRAREIAVYFDQMAIAYCAWAYDKAARSIEAAKGLHRLLDEGRLAARYRAIIDRAQHDR